MCNGSPPRTIVSLAIGALLFQNLTERIVSRTTSDMRHDPDASSANRTAALVVTAMMACGLAYAAPGSAQPRRIDVNQSTMTVRVFKSGLFRAFADDHVIRAPLAEGSLDDSATPSVQIVVDARGMRVLDPGLSAKSREEVQTRMLGPEVLDVSRFGEIRFQSAAIDRSDAQSWKVRGDLTLHGQQHAVAMSVTLVGGRYKGTATIKQTDFGITPISVAGGTVKVKDDIKVDFEIATVDRRLAVPHAAGMVRPERGSRTP